MGRYIAKKLLMGLVIVFGMITLVFIMVRLAPGNPISIIAGDRATPELIERLTAQYGLDKPVYVQWWKYVTSIIRGDFGNSILLNQPILPHLLYNLKYTFHLMIGATVFAVFTGIPLGILTAVKRNSWLDHIVRMFSLLGVSMPSFWFGLLLLIFFSIRLGIFPVSGAGVEGNILSTIVHLILPSITLGWTFSAMIARLTRTTMLEVLNEQYVTTAKAYGIAWPKILIKHAFKNASIPVVTMTGIQFGRLISMGLIVETVFARPGVGSFMIKGILNQDYNVIQACVILTSMVVVLINILLDISYVLLDPRIEY